MRRPKNSILLLFTFCCLISTQGFAELTSTTGQIITGLEADKRAHLYVTLEGYSNPACNMNRILFKPKRSEDKLDTGFSLMYTMLLSAYHAETKIQVDITPTCVGTNVIMIKE